MVSNNCQQLNLIFYKLHVSNIIDTQILNKNFKNLGYQPSRLHLIWQIISFLTFFPPITRVL